MSSVRCKWFSSYLSAQKDVSIYSRTWSELTKLANNTTQLGEVQLHADSTNHSPYKTYFVRQFKEVPHEKQLTSEYQYVYELLFWNALQLWTKQRFAVWYRLNMLFYEQCYFVFSSVTHSASEPYVIFGCSTSFIFVLLLLLLDILNSAEEDIINA